MILDPFLIVDCSSCEEDVAIRDINSITIYIAKDDIEHYVEVICECGKLIKDRVSKQICSRLVRHGVITYDFDVLFSPLTTELIDKWNIDKELEEFYARF